MFACVCVCGCLALVYRNIHADAPVYDHRYHSLEHIFMHTCARNTSMQLRYITTDEEIKQKQCVYTQHVLHLTKEHQQDVNHAARYAKTSLPRPAQVTRMGRHTIDTVFSLQHNTLELKLEIEIW